MDSVERPLISVIIPAYNRERYIAEAIESVLIQRYDPIELIVVDDGSTDGTADVVKGYGDQLIYVHQENKGIAEARNAGIYQATGEYLAFLDSDDIWVRNKLINQMAVFEADSDLDVVYGHAEQFFSPEMSDEAKRKLKIPHKKLPSFISVAMLIKRQSFDKVGLYDPEFSAGVDIDWHARSKEAGLKSIMLPEVVYHRRVHESNNTQSASNANLVRLRALKASLDRRRKAGTLEKEPA